MITTDLMDALHDLKKLQPTLTLAQAVDAGARQLGYLQPHLVTDAELTEGLTQILAAKRQLVPRVLPAPLSGPRFSWRDAQRLLPRQQVGSDELMWNITLADDTRVFSYTGKRWVADTSQPLIRVAYRLCQALHGEHHLPLDWQLVAMVSLALDADRANLKKLTPATTRAIVGDCEGGSAALTRARKLFPTVDAAIRSFF